MSSSSLNSENPYATIKDLPGLPPCPPESSYMEMKSAVPRERSYTEISPPAVTSSSLVCRGNPFQHDVESCLISTDARACWCVIVFPNWINITMYFFYFRTLFPRQRSWTGNSESLWSSNQQPHPRALRPAPGTETTISFATETATLISGFKTLWSFLIITRIWMHWWIDATKNNDWGLSCTTLPSIGHYWMFMEQNVSVKEGVWSGHPRMIIFIIRRTVRTPCPRGPYFLRPRGRDMYNSTCTRKVQ